MSGKKILCMLQICCYPTNSGSNSGAERIQQYVKGLTKFFEYNDIFKKQNVDIYIVDNSIKDGDSLPAELLTILPDSVIINTSLNNTFGCVNKGAGLIEQWLYCKDIIEKYDWLIHFEPRQLLLNFNFINDFLENPRNLFKISGPSFNTGLFAIKTNLLINFTNNVDFREMAHTPIECKLYEYFIKNMIPFSLTEKIYLIWHDVATKQFIIL